MNASAARSNATERPPVGGVATSTCNAYTPPNCCASSLKDSDEFKQMAAQVNHLQEQVDTLFNNLNALRAEPCEPVALYTNLTAPMTGPSTSSTPTSTTMTMLPQPRQPPFAFRGPTSNRFSLDVAKNTLHKMGYSYQVTTPMQTATPTRRLARLLSWRLRLFHLPRILRRMHCGNLTKMRWFVCAASMKKKWASCTLFFASTRSSLTPKR